MKRKNDLSILSRSTTHMTSKTAEKARFVLVGMTNTVIDFGVLFILGSLGLPVLTANIISTTIAFCFSFFANRKFTFKAIDGNLKRQIPLFIIVTLFGLWVLQTIVISLISPPLTEMGITGSLNTLVAKVIATIITLIWNYTLYSRLVFRKATPDAHRD